MLIDANLLLYARNNADERYERARDFLVATLNGPTRVGLPWQCLSAFLRISTNLRIFERPLTAAEAWNQVREWLDAPSSWVPVPTERHAAVFGDLVLRYDVTGPLVSDAELAALAIEHGVALCTCDGDFARFKELRLVDPFAG